jgi:prepilin-type N-terminal cleavage/methylation domain-containing protein
MIAHFSVSTARPGLAISNEHGGFLARRHVDRSLHFRLLVPSERGFTLLEVLIATTIVSVALVSLAQLFVLSAHANRSAKATTAAALLALQKMEQLRSLSWSVDVRGSPLTDPSLAASSSDALRLNTAGFFDFVDGVGRSLGEAPAPPPGAMYLRRWSVEPLPTDAGNVLVLQVLVTQRFHRSIDTAASRHRQPDEARFVCVRTRKAM